MQLDEQKEQFVNAIETDLKKSVKHNKVSIEKIALSYTITNKNLIKELTELAIVRVARSIAKLNIDSYDKYCQIIELYNNQANLSQRTSKSMLLQQYSTPAPIAFIASLYVLDDKNLDFPLYFEPSAGNGLLTIALPYAHTIVNELDDIRLDNLRSQSYALITNQDATTPFIDYYKKFDGITTNPPFGPLIEAIIYDGYTFKTLDHLMALRALDTMKDTGKAAIIIGGHTDWDELGRIQAGKNRLLFNYLYSHYNIEDVISIDGHKLYSRQGTAFNVRLILVNGRKEKISGFAPLKNDSLREVVFDFNKLWERVFNYSSSQQKKELWKMTLSEFSNEVYNNGYDFERLGLDKKHIQLNVKNYHATTDEENKKLSKELIDKAIEQYYIPIVCSAYFDGKNVPANVGSQSILNIKKDKENETTSSSKKLKLAKAKMLMLKLKII